MSQTAFLELVSVVVVPATTSKFVAREKFVFNFSHKAKVRIGDLNEKFYTWFLPRSSKIEDSMNEQTLRCHKLRKSSVGGSIIEELGGEAKAETTLPEMFTLIEKQGKGEDGVLLNNFWSNIFYIKDVASVLRTVSVRWSHFGWRINADSIVEDSYAWGPGSQVFSRWGF